MGITVPTPLLGRADEVIECSRCLSQHATESSARRGM
jgi:hypothetical protein